MTFEGEYYRTDKATIYDRPEQPVPIWLAASGPAATRFAGRQGDGYITTSGKDPALYTDTLLPAVAEGAEKAGRSVERHRDDDRGQGLLRPRPRRGHAGDAVLGRARA